MSNTRGSDRRSKPGTVRDFDALARDLSAESRRVRSDAVTELGAIGDARAVKMICGALKDPRKEVRAKAAQTLGHLRRADCVSALAEALHDRTGTVRRRAITAIARAGRVDEALELLLPLLADPDRSVRQRTAEACGSLCDPRVVEPMLASAEHADEYLQHQIMVALAPLRDLRTVLFLCATIKSGGRGLSSLAVRHLRSLGDSERLSRALVRARPLSLRYRYEALEALRTVRTGGWFRALVRGYTLPPIPEYCRLLAETDLDPEIRREASSLLDYTNLLRGSEPASRQEELLRATMPARPDPAPKTLLRGAAAQNPEPAGHRKWPRLLSFPKR